MSKNNNLRVTKSPKEEIHNFIKEIEEANKYPQDEKNQIDYAEFQILLQDYSKIYQDNKYHSLENPNKKTISCLIKAANNDYNNLDNDIYWNDVMQGATNGALVGSTISFLFVAIVSGSPIAKCIYAISPCIMATSLSAGGMIGSISAGYSSTSNAKLKAFADTSSICIAETEKYEMAGELSDIENIE